MAAPSTILVTGGGSGIGHAIVQAILAEGWRVVVADLSADNYDGLANFCIKAGIANPLPTA